MNKKELITPFLVAALSLLFVAICFMVFLSNGKSKKWISKKIYIGGLLVSLITIADTGCIRRSSCYVISREHVRQIYSNKTEIKIQHTDNNLIKGIIKRVHSENYSYCIKNLYSRDEIRKGNVIPTDGKFDQVNEYFEIRVDEKLDKGEYVLTIYGHDSNDESHSYPIESSKIKI